MGNLNKILLPFKHKTTGNELTNLVYQYLKLIESDYFGLEFVDYKGKKVIVFILFYYIFYNCGINLYV